MEEDRLRHWQPIDRVELGLRLRKLVKFTGHHESVLWEELLRRLENPDERALPRLSAEVAAEKMGIFGGNPHQTVYVIAHTVREEIKKASKYLSPDPQVFISNKIFEICAETDAPREWSKLVSPAIGLLISDAADWFVGPLLLGVTDVCNQHGYDVVIDFSQEDSKLEARKLQHMTQRSHGVLLVPVGDKPRPDTKQLLQKYPCVLVDRYIAELPHVPSVHPDDITAGRQAALYLKKRECTRIIVVEQGPRSHVPFDITPLKDRWMGCKLQADEDGISIERVLVQGSDEEGGFRALRQFEEDDTLRNGDGIFAMTDRLALGCRHFLSKRSCPLDLPLISIEGQSFGDFLIPPLTSIGFDMVEMGRLAAKTLFERMCCELLERDSLSHILLSPTLLEPDPAKGKRVRTPLPPDPDSYAV